MALVPVTHVYDTLSVINNTGLLEGQILYTTDQIVNKIFADVKVNNILRRIEIGGTNEIDTVLNQESGHAIANSAVAKLAQTVHTNLLNPTLGTKTINGVTCTKNSDNTYTLTGTATSDSLFVIRTAIDTLELPKTYRLVGCPSGGGGSTFELNTVKIVGTSRSVFATDRGNGATIEYVSGATYEVQIRIANNAVLDNVTFKPMLTTDLSATYDDYVQYSGNGELNQNVADLYNNLTALDTKVGAQSLLPTPSQSVTQNINTLKAEINQINSNLTDALSSISSLITLTSGMNFTSIDYIEQLNKHFMLFSCNSIVPINSSVSMPIYTKGIFITPNDSANSDGMLIAVGFDARLYVAFRNGSNWNQAKKL